MDGNADTGDVLLHESRNPLVHATSRLVSVVGLQDVVVVETPDAVMVSDRLSSLHRKVHRPWAWYDSIDAGRVSRSSASWSTPAPA